MEWSDPALRYAACWYCMTLHGFDPSQPSFPHRPRPMHASVLLRPARGGVGGWVLKNSAMPSRCGCAVAAAAASCACCTTQAQRLRKGQEERELAFPQVRVAISGKCWWPLVEWRPHVRIAGVRLSWANRSGDRTRLPLV